MLRQPTATGYYDGFNEYLFRQVPPEARRIVEVGCARGRLGLELKNQVPGRTVIGIERDPDAAAVAATRLDEVHVCDLEREFPPLEPGSVDCVIFGDVLEHLYDPEALLATARDLLTPSGRILVCVPNFGHLSIVRALLRSDLMYQPDGLVDATHIRFFTRATMFKMLLDVGLLPDLVDVINSGGTDHALPAATPLLQYFRVPPPTGLKSLDAYQYVFSATRQNDVVTPAPSAAISFAVLINDEDQLTANLLRSPCLWEGTRHQLIRLPGQTSAAAGLTSALARAEHDLVVLVQQDMYLPRDWDTRFLTQYAAATAELGPLGVAGLFGLRYGAESPDSSLPAGRIVDRDHLLDHGGPFPQAVDGIDEVLLALRRDTPLTPDPGLGFHLYGSDLCLQASRLGLANVVLDAPAYHNSLFADVDSAFHDARETLLATWPDVRPLYSNMGRLDTARRPEPSPPEADRASELQTELDEARAALDRSEQRLHEVLNSRTWRVGTTLGRAARRLTRRA